MAAKKRGLGRGLDALLGGAQSEPEAKPHTGAGTGDSLNRLPVDLIQRGRYQPRREFDADTLHELAESIAAQGVIQPVIVRPVENGRYELIAGERRWRAAQQAGLDEIPVVVKEVTEEAAMAMGLIENIQREDLNPLEEANALSRLLHEFGLTHQEVAKAVGKSRTTVTNLLRLLELNEEVKSLVESRRLEMGHARSLLGLKGEIQTKTADQVVKQGLSVRETERLVRRLQGEAESPKQARPPVAVDPDIRRLVNDLSEKLGAKVDLQQGAKGKGKLVIGYNSLDELEGIIDHIK
ncbi:MAG: ParB/RepB/Spo0J family partition protein [Candidatus Thiodiazotropha sp. (ex Semelilucina semeliformis)]|nr:ParB/RepB/Spo0J family partition protein [Candidatus Thiodiazotropha sp. (ex Myrtea spinifera)]MCU7807046.1 ParB/RepB/Spo0J family partition protein [Candidatus Thiodiazotropha sp. (ex Semelilucina semeliformis)]MCU7828566.1 ParB/RepB/Spo0J family partition protein [Candidatus Thiodiazotropha sp. (ex Myrtea sp. 'scaly one' KF741663)]